MNKDYFVKSIEPGLWMIGTSFVHAFLLEGQTKAMLIDTGLGDFPVGEAVKSVTSKPVFVVCTHGHEDHAGGAVAMSSAYLHPADHGVFRSFFPNAETQLLPVGEPVSFDLGGLTVKVIDTPGHTPGSITLLDETNGRIFTGDLVDAGINVIPPNSDRHLLQAYWESLNKLWSLRASFQKIYPSHGSELPLPADKLTAIAGCTEGILQGTLLSRPHCFAPAPDVPPLNGQLYDTGDAAILLIESIPKLNDLD